MKTGKHVIFLGAGASKCSGYPLANELRLLISSRSKWEEALVQYEKKHNLTGRPITNIALAYWDKHANVLDIFRNGGFATLDEFCKLAGSKFWKEINTLRCLVRAVLGLFNPEETFEKSEYYGFVQKVFRDDLLNLREDITVLTYNYDPYLEFLLKRALTHRFQVLLFGTTGLAAESIKQKYDRFLSDLSSLGNISGLNDEGKTPAFRMLKLHGSISYQKDSIASPPSLFSSDPISRAEKLFGATADIYIPPILFPWDIITDKGFVEEDSLLLFETQPELYHLFRGMWERAKFEVQKADKISFVGLSMHPYLFDGLKYLFEDKSDKVEICVANPDNTPFVPGRNETHWNRLTDSPAYAVSQILNKVAPKMTRWGKTPNMSQGDGDITLVKNFAEFVKTQMTALI